MSKFLRTFGKISGIAAAIGNVIAPGNPISMALSINSALMTTIAGAKKPVARGQMQSRVFGSNAPMPYAMGRTYAPGVQVHEAGWGGKVGKVYNPYKFIPVVYSCAGPIQSIDEYLMDYAPISFSGAAAVGYYNGFLYRSVQLGASPEAAALSAAAGWGTPPGWGADYKLSGFAAVGWSFRFDKDGKVFASGIPPFGVVGHWVKTYDPREDSSFPGGSGAHRIDDEATWEWSECPSQHAVAYALGRRQNGKIVFGPNLEATGIDLGTAVAWSNVCDFNNWKVGGTVQEPGDAWNNLKLICQAGGAEPTIGSDGILSFKYQAPRVSLARIKRAHIKGDAADVAGGRTFRDRYNKIIPKFRSEANQWTYVQASAQKVDAFIADDGEEIETELQYDLVQQVDQSAELALYEIYQRREPGPFSIPLGPEFQNFLPGDTLTLDEDAGLWREEIDLVVVNRAIDPLSGLVSFEFEGETTAKHAAVLGATATAPDPVTLTTGEERDGAIGGNMDPAGYELTLIQTSYVSGVAGATLTSQDAGGSATVSVATHNRVYPDKTVSVTGAGPAFTGQTNDADRHVFYDDPGRAGGAVTYQITSSASAAAASDANPARHYVGYIRTAAIGGADTGGGGGSPPGWGGGGYDGPIP